VYTRSGAASPWRPVTTLRHATRRVGDGFGAAVAIDGEFVLIGAPGRAGSAGAVSVFRLLGGAWTEVATVQGSEVLPGERFGSALALDANRLLVGAPGPFPGDTSPTLEGSAYAFDGVGGQFVERTRLPSGESGPALFGYVLVLDGDQAFVGAPVGNEVSGVVHHFVIDASGEWVQGPPSQRPRQLRDPGTGCLFRTPQGISG
jgi:hypothetical protein